MQSVRRHRLVPILLLCAGAFANGAVSAQQATSAQTAPAPLPPPIYQPGELPPLPTPTEEQLQRGRELLDKIVYVVANVPLTDAAAVLKVFGFTELSIKEYSTHADVGPKGKASQFARTEELAGTGFSDIRIQPWIDDPRIKITSWLNATVVTEELCISINDVRQLFDSVTAHMNMRRIVETHPSKKPVPLHGIGVLSFSPLVHPTGKQASISFVFEYQTCVKEFNFAYRENPKELNK